MIDTHAHLFLSDQPLDDLIQNAKHAGLTHIINVGINLDTSKAALDSSRAYPDFIKASVGIHPGETQDADKLAQINALASENGVVALGEMGLDYFKMYAPKDQQIACFEAQLELARTLTLPVIIHNRDANDDIIAICRQFPSVKKVFHCFSGSIDFVESLSHENHFFSFTGQITYSKKGKTVNSIRQLPLDRIMIETDCPYLTPKAFKGSENEPAFVGEVLKKIAEIKDMDISKVSTQLEKNSRNFFNINTSA